MNGPVPVSPGGGDGTDELRATVAAAIVAGMEEQCDFGHVGLIDAHVHWPNVAAAVLDALAAAGFAVVQLPEPDEDREFRYGDYRGYVYADADDGCVYGKWGAEYGTPEEVRSLAAALLAAAAVSSLPTTTEEQQ